MQKKDFTDEGFPCIHYGQIYTHYGTYATVTKSFCSPKLAKKLKKAQFGDLLIAGTSENLQDLNKTTLRIGNTNIAFSGDMFAFRPNNQIESSFLNHLFQTNAYFDHKKKYAKGTKVIRVSSNDLLKFLIPIPPLEQQQQIVAILDKFDTLVNDLNHGIPAEITARKNQYHYFRTKLLSFSPLRQ